MKITPKKINTVIRWTRNNGLKLSRLACADLVHQIDETLEHLMNQDKSAMPVYTAICVAIGEWALFNGHYTSIQDDRKLTEALTGLSH